MKSSSWLQTGGFALLGFAFALSVWKVFTYTKQENDPNVRTLRFAHWQLEDGVSGALDQAARDYEKLHPGVRIIQIRIPEKVYPNWVTTQLVGGTAPDLIQIGKGIDQARLARFFDPITDEVIKPNPYNVGSPLEGVPWRDTFIDGMTGGFDETLQDYYGAPLFMATVRMYYNRSLMRDITGSDQPPRNFAEMIELADKTREFSRRENRLVVPIAGSRYNAPILIERVFASMTQRLGQDLATRRQFQFDGEQMLVALLQDRWNLETPALQSSLKLASQLGRHMQPGFMQLDREDATFLFEQGRALMVATGSWDATTLFNRPSFPVGVFDLPAPSPQHPEYGRFVMGRHSEQGVRSYGPLGIPNVSKNRELALDFLRFVTSQPGNQNFTTRSGWLPVTLNVKPVDSVAPFMPVFDGYPDGFTLTRTTEMRRVVETNFHLLFGPEEPVQRFVDNVSGPLKSAGRADLVRLQRDRVQQLTRADLTVTANEMLAAQNADEAEAYLRRARGQRERQFGAETAHAHVSTLLEE